MRVPSELIFMHPASELVIYFSRGVFNIISFIFSSTIIFTHYIHMSCALCSWNRRKDPWKASSIINTKTVRVKRTHERSKIISEANETNESFNAVTCQWWFYCVH